MRPGTALGRSDRAIERWSRSQHNIVTLAQLEALGLSPRAARHRAAAGRLVRIHRGVYSIGRPTVEGRWMAALLACGAGAVLSHRSAAMLWDIQDASPGEVDVTVLTRSGRSRAGIVAHRADALDPADITHRRRIRCTSLARTLLDLAAVVDRRALERAVDRAEELRAFDLIAIQAVLERHPGRRGSRPLRGVLGGYSGPSLTRSEAEERMLALIDEAALPRPSTNAWIALENGSGYSADFLWRQPRLIVEVDGRTYHAKRKALVSDRRRDRRLALAGFETRRYAASEVIDDPDHVAAEIRAFLHLSH
jgi:Transcriptional regulator, AbiEi antitoxin/Protein of unknown function (DUF559)